MQVVYSDDPIPTKINKSIFLAGPTPRSAEVESWRPKALELLEQMGYDGHVFVPEWKSPGQMPEGFIYEDQVKWETQALNMADVIVFWVPRELKDMPAFTTNVEFGVWVDSGKTVFGYPPGAEKNRYLEDLAKSKKVPVSFDLKETLSNALVKIGEGADREGGEAQVPLLIWRHPTFQRWYESQKAVGNRLGYARVLWNFRVGTNRDFVFCFALHVKMWVESEQRLKWNEFVFGRTDMSSLVLYYKPLVVPFPVWTPLDIEVVLIKEFRSPARTPTGFIYEVPGGSAKKNNNETLRVAVEELKEETSFSLDIDRVVPIDSLQVAGTLSAHTNTCFAYELTREERDQFVELKNSGKTFGVAADTEITYVDIQPLKEIIEKKMVDWANLGMIFTAIFKCE